MAKDISGPGTKCLWVESPEHSKSDCEDGNMVKQQPSTLLAPKTTVAYHLTEVIIGVEPFKTGDAEEGVSMLQTAAEVTEETEKILTQELQPFQSYYYFTSIL